MELVRKQTRIAVPRMRRAIPHHHPEGNGLIVMDLVPNSQQLRVAWLSPSVLGKLKVVLTMRFTYAGFDASNTLRPTTYPVRWVRRPYLPMAFNSGTIRKTVPLEVGHLLQIVNASAFASLTFTHNDLNMRNLLLNNHHVLWVVDWGFSGFYPPWFEYLGMRYAAQKDRDPES
ncbi:hypothetical protein ARMGADRAFT_1159667 [Armillaria gallica]|uniref:Aminoglycoside phosphotransferase domain-containing protein n=1 Tax=Armillaria gallica TaxID=47427 RepID=A0A2H3DYN9_ARMGA|nr:hypothetical protein ARMGADRAFT_1159667 [Armillaria gallica]